jgi:hypothetical protein
MQIWRILFINLILFFSVLMMKNLFILIIYFIAKKSLNHFFRDIILFLLYEIIRIYFSHNLFLIWNNFCLIIFEFIFIFDIALDFIIIYLLKIHIVEKFMRYQFNYFEDMFENKEKVESQKHREWRWNQPAIRVLYF